MTYRSSLPAVVLSAILIVSLTGPLAAVTAPVTLVESNEVGITLVCEPGKPILTTLTTDDGDYISVLLPHSRLMASPGSPDLPCIRVMVAVPDCEAIELQLTTDGIELTEGVRVAPAASLVQVPAGELSGYEWQEGSVYETSGLWPPSAASIEGPRWFATQRVVVVEFHPVQFDPALNTLVSQGRIEARLTFGGLKRGTASEDGRPREDAPRRETMFRSALLNYESGRAWRRVGGRPEAPGRRDEDSFNTSSNWVKMSISEGGFYSVPYEALVSLGVQAGSIDPATIRVFSGGGLSMPPSVFEPRPDWMNECTIQVSGEGDGLFDPGDRVIFYALGVDGWSTEFDAEDPVEPYHENHFANEGVSWLTWENHGTSSGFSADPLRMEEDDLQNSPTPNHADAHRVRAHFENNIVMRQGKSDNWFWHEMTASESRRYFHKELSHVRTDSLGGLAASVYGNSSFYPNPDHHAIFSLNGVVAHDALWEGYWDMRFEVRDVSINEGYNTLEIYLPRDIPDATDESILIDWFDITYWRDLVATNDRAFFGSSDRTGIVEYTVTGFQDTDAAVYKIIDKFTVRTIPGVSRGIQESARGLSDSGRVKRGLSDSGRMDGAVVFQDEAADTASYAAISSSAYLTPSLELDEPADLRTPGGHDYIMVAHDDFYDEAARLKSLRESAAGGSFDVRLVKVSDVYDEFSWGLVDPTAIRDYLKYTWENEAVPPTHAILIGGGTPDPRGYASSSIPTHIPVRYTRRSAVSFEPLYWPTDVWYACFEDSNRCDMNIALGRLSVDTPAEAATMVDKIERYELDEQLGLWKNTAILVADDEYSSTNTTEWMHTEQTEQLATDILPFPLDRQKIYLMEYDKVGSVKPAARAAVIDAWNEGALLLNYTGHGSEIVIAHESVFLYDDVSLLSNIDVLPLFFAASCRLNKFDNETVDSLGEALAKSARGGSIISIGSTRDSGASQNANFNRDFFGAMFGYQLTSPGAVMDVGSAFQIAFSMWGSLSTWWNNSKFVVLGDPGLTLAAPAGGGVLASDDLPMRRGATIQVDGDGSGAIESLDGVALVRVSESADTTGYTQIPGGYHVDYSLPGETIFRGPVVVSDGVMATEFVVSTASREGPYARIRAYGYGSDTDGAFSLEGVGLVDSVEVTDHTGPDIALEFEGGGVSVLPSATLKISLSDDSGINLATEGGGRGIILQIDSGDSTDLTDEFICDLGDFRSGSFEYDLPSMSLGGHSLSLSASDNVGNRRSEDLWFEVITTTDFEIRNVANHPNPFPDIGREGTHILFQLSVAADVRIDIFTVGGRRIVTLDDIDATAGANQVFWDGRDHVGDELANGVYLYRVSAVSKSYRGDKAEAVGRAVIMR